MFETSGAASINEIKTLIDSESKSLFAHRAEWSLLEAPQDLEVVAHILRVILHLGRADDYKDDFLALTKCQNKDGGWAPFSSKDKSEVWAGTFCAIMLIRANQIFHTSSIDESLKQFTGYLIVNQEDDGLWTDPRWADIDAVSHPVQFLSLTSTLNNNGLHEIARTPLKKGIAFLLRKQDDNGGWTDNGFYKSCVCLTAHIVQDSLLPDLLITKSVAADVYKRAVDRLVELQANDGSWDDNDVDHTCDTLRTLMLSSVMLAGADKDKIDKTIQNGMKWMLSLKNEEGWGDFPGEKSNIERTSDAIDTLIKYSCYSQSDNSDLLKLWGYR
ncbi:MAG: prenyltransferase/squalene oxidase repeat-containing protein [Candidatus Anammoxibacter sp.]